MTEQPPTPDGDAMPVFETIVFFTVIWMLLTPWLVAIGEYVWAGAWTTSVLIWAIVVFRSVANDGTTNE